VHRQIGILGNGESVPQETRGFNEDTGETFALRSKEEAPDYRYMPDPNLPPLFLTPVRSVAHRRGLLAHLPLGRNISHPSAMRCPHLPMKFESA
jgi:Asp-tRNA(Asn)/Glu-tRNA(Gln) amidotransferase B subunit